MGIKNLFLICVAGIFIYLSFEVGKFYFYYYNLKIEARDLLDNAHYFDDARIKNSFIKSIDDYGVPIKDKYLIIGRDKSKAVIRTKYKEKLYLHNYLLYEFKFYIDEERRFK